MTVEPLPVVSAWQDGVVNRSVPISEVPALASNPEAGAKIYLDFDGHFEPIWGAYRDVSTPVFSLDNDLTTFSQSELHAITQIWQRVAEDYAPFNIDVTTIDPASFDDRVGLRVSIGGNGSWYGSAGGVAYRNTWTNAIVNTVYVFPERLARNAKYIAEASSHEAGHAFGLQHQSRFDANGIETDEYNPGSGEWVPIMGISYYKARTTWHHGPTLTATTLQDDMQVISSAFNGFGFRTDDYGSTSSPTLVSLSGGGTTLSGIIEQNADQDAVQFQIPAGQLNITLAVASVGPNLDSVVQLRDDSGVLLASADPSNTYGASISQNVPAGTYTVVVSGSGGYGSVGQYSLDIELIRTNSPPDARDDSFDVDEDSATTRLNVLANDTALPDNAESLTITGVSAGSAGGTISITGGTAIDYKPAADFFGTETFSYTISDGTPGSNDTASVTLTVRPVNDPPTAGDDEFTVIPTNALRQLDVLANDTIAPDARETLTIVSVSSGSAGGTITIGDNKIDYQPAPGFVGEEVFSYTINDGTPGSDDTASVTVRVQRPQAVDFREYVVGPYGGPDEDRLGAAFVKDSGPTLHMLGNVWKKIDLAYEVTANTVIEFDFRSNSAGEIHGIGFDTDLVPSADRTFKVHGREDWGIQDYDNYDTAPSFKHYRIPVGRYYTGTFDYLFFINDEDSAKPWVEGVFSNVKVFEDAASSAALVSGSTARNEPISASLVVGQTRPAARNQQETSPAVTAGTAGSANQHDVWPAQVAEETEQGLDPSGRAVPLKRSADDRDTHDFVFGDCDTLNDILRQFRPPR